MYNHNLFLKIHIFSFFVNNIIKFERTDFMEENFNSGKDENINLTILNEINKAAKMGMDSISYVLKKVGDENMKCVPGAWVSWLPFGQEDSNYCV